MPRFRIAQFGMLTVIVAIVLAVLIEPSSAAIAIISMLVGLKIVAPRVLSFVPGSLESVLRAPPEELDQHAAAL